MRFPVAKAILAVLLCGCSDRVAGQGLGTDGPPSGVAHPIVTDEDTPALVKLSGISARDPESLLQVTLVRAPAGGTLESGQGPAPMQARYLPRPHFNGPDSLEFTVTDSRGVVSAPVVVSIEVRAVNDRPVATPVARVSTGEKSAVEIVLAGTDVEDPPGSLTVDVIGAPARGTLDTLGGLGPLTVVYTPDADRPGLDLLQFTVTDRDLATSAPVTVEIDVAGFDDPPAAQDLAVSLDEDGATVLVLEGTDPEGAALSIGWADRPAHGTLLGADGRALQLPAAAPMRVRYTPAADFHGEDGFEFGVHDGGTGTATGVVLLTVRSINDAPVATALEPVAGLEDTAAGLILTGADVEDTELLVEVVVPPARGRLDGLLGPAPLRVTYTPDPQFNGEDAFQFTVTDPEGAESQPELVRIDVVPVNDVPEAQAVTLSLDEDTATDLVLTGQDVEPGPLAIAIEDGPAHGTLAPAGALRAPLRIRYTPAADFAGADGFAFTLADADTTSLPALVRITVRPLNDLPVLGPVGDQFAEAGRPFLFAPEVTDPDAGDVLTFALTGAALPAWAQFDPATGRITGTPGASDVAITGGLILTVHDQGGFPVSSLPFSLTVLVSPPYIDFFDLPEQVEIKEQVTARWRISEGLPVRTVLDPGGFDVTGLESKDLVPFPTRPRGLGPAVWYRLSATNAVAGYETTGVRTGRAVGGPARDEIGAVDGYNDGAVAVVGSFEDAATFGDAGERLVSAGRGDVFVAKYARDGSLLWAKRAGGSGADAALAVASQQDGGVIVAGFFEGTASFGDGATTLASAGGEDAFLARYFADGRLHLAVRLGGPLSDRALAVTRGYDGAPIVAGTFRGQLSAGEGDAATTLVSAGGDDAFVARWTIGGLFTWARRIGGPGDDEARAVAERIDRGMFVAGAFTGAAVFGPGEAGEETVVSAGAADLFLASLGMEGQFQWVRTAGGAGVDRVQDMGLGARDVVLTGHFEDGAVFGRGELRETALSASGRRAFVGRFSRTDGKLEWARPAGPAGVDSAVGLSGMGDDSVVVLGGASGAMGQTWLARFELDGTMAWEKSLAASGGTAPVGITSGGGDLYLAGAFLGALPLEPVRGRQLTLRASGLDGFLARLEPLNARYQHVRPKGVDWVVHPEGALSADQRVSVAAFPDGGSLMVTGLRPGTRFGAADLCPPDACSGIFAVAKHDVDGRMLWARASASRFGGGPGGVDTWPDGAFVVAGNFSDAATFGAGEPNETRVVSRGPSAAFLARFDAAGQLSWVATGGGILGAGAVSVAAAPDGSAYVLGGFRGTAGFDGESVTAIGGRDVFLAHYGPDGRVLWVRRVGGAGDDRVFQVVAFDVGGAAILGDFEGTAEFGGTPIISRGWKDVFVVRYSAAGAMQWVHRIGGVDDDDAHGMVALAGGSLAVSGNFINNVTLGTPGLNSLELHTTGGHEAMFLASLTPDGGIRWARTVGGNHEHANGLAAYLDGSVLMMGSFGEWVTLGAGQPRETTLLTEGGYDGFIARYHHDGTLLWARQIGSALYDEANAAVVLSDNSILVGGRGGVTFGAPLPPATTVFGRGEANVQSVTSAAGLLFLVRLHSYP